MSAPRFAAATVAACLIVACSSSNTTGLKTGTGTPAPGTIAGTVTNGTTLTGIGNATVTVTPAGAAALPSVTTSASGAYTVTSVAVGSGQVAVSNLPAGCTVPAPASYSVASGITTTINIAASCQSHTTGSTTTLNVGQAALFADSPQFATNLTVAANGVYLMAIVNTDTASASIEDFSLSGTFTQTGASRVAAGPPQGLRFARRAAARSSAPALRLDPQLQRDLRYLRAAERGHVAYMDRATQYAQRFRAKLPTLRASRQAIAASTMAGVRSLSLVNTQIGDINTIHVPVPSADNPTDIGVRTVYVGQHVQVVADTSVTNWPAQYRPDSSYYIAFGQEYDTLTYAKHMLTYIGDPLQYDATKLSGAGKVTVVLTPVLNNLGSGGVSGGGMILAFVSPCDLVPTSVCPASNNTEMFYHLVPNANYSVDFWERELRPTAAHETKHIVSLGAHLYQGNAMFEQVWLEEGLAQISSEIWGRNYNTATWRGDAGFAQTLGCEVSGYPAACNTPTSPRTFLGSHFSWLHDYLQGVDSIPETLNGTTPGRYGAGWSIARWTIDQFANGSTPSAEAAMVKSLINNVGSQGFSNLSSTIGLSPQTIMLDWSLAVALDTVSLLDSSSFIPTDAKSTIPSFDLRNVFSVAGNGGLYGPAAPLRAAVVNPGPISGSITGIPATEPFYVEIVANSSSGTQSLQLLSGSGGPISASSGWRVAIIRIQ